MKVYLIKSCEASHEVIYVSIDNFSETNTPPTFCYPTSVIKTPVSSAAISIFSCSCAVSGFEDLPGQKGSHLLSYSGIHLQTYPERFLLPSQRKNMDIPWSFAVWGSVRFGSVQCVCEGKPGLQGTAEPFSSTAGTFGRTDLGKGEIFSAAPGGPWWSRHADGLWRSCRTHTEATAAYGGGDQHWGRENCEEGEATEVFADWHRIPTSHCPCTTHRGRRLKSQEWSWAWEKGEVGHSSVVVCHCFSLSRFFFPGKKFISVKLSLFCPWL